MNILLTGPCGRLGYTTFSKLLEYGHTVRCFDTKDGFLSHPEGFNESIERYWRNKGYEFEWQWGDLRNLNDVKQAVADDIDVIIHHGAMTLPSHCEEEWEYCWDVNYQGTLNIIQAIQASAKKPKLLYASSVANYGYPPADEKAFNETASLPSTCTYAATKIASEIAIRKSGISYSIMRIASAIDFRAPHLLMVLDPSMESRIGKERKLKSVNSPGHFVSANDVNEAFINAIDNPETDNKIFNLAGPEDCRTTFSAMEAAISNAIGSDPISDDAWGNGPYPQYYYDVSKTDAILKSVKTSKQGIIDSMINAIGDIEDFMTHSQA